MSGKIGFLYAVTQIHAGKGMDVGVVDQPIQREVHTGFPIISGIKGAIRNEIDFGNDDISIFGSRADSKEETNPGNVTFSEAKILFFPLRSINRGMVWITCPLALSRLKTAFEVIGNKDVSEKISDLLQSLDLNKEYSTFDNSNVSLEEFVIEPEKSEKLKKLLGEIKDFAPDDYLKNILIENTILLKDEDFAFFVKNATEVLPRIRIDRNTGVVKEGALWYEEYLPQDSVMFFIIKPLKKDENLIKIVSDKLDNQYINVGGKASVGKGFAFIKLM
ncbi:type III-B CRISPR module RAMP protein Cmr4 [Marinitoga sp. 38H-ov]|uniref:type III-B CRISPR module RAMP protein Cmr4 n=1 Tax=Marinitoga sp. 38H-ov TaxID=1755814 RepID=UPI0013ED8965|nr:type III-B CRISPR module RAMP protein Cmr4 [Marinitoga sp. 38H-ov]KAF2956645.1 type III-B CRISPR module RAMP protein Cmr4 [Marinitoga sp. 38H-ov]